MATRPIQTGIEATGLSDPNLSSASFVRDAPVDRSAAIKSQGQAQALQMGADAIRTAVPATTALADTISKSVGLGLQVHKDFVLGDLQEQKNKEIDMFVARQQAPQLQTELETSQSLFNSLRERLGEGATIQQSAPEMQQFEEKSAMLKKALDQGALSVNELEMRLHAMTRQAINRNPGLQDEILNHAENTLRISGIRSIKEVNNRMEDAQQQIIDDMHKQLSLDVRKYHHPVDWSLMRDPNYLVQVNQEINNIKTSQKAANDAEMAYKSGLRLDEEEAKQYARTTLPKQITGTIYNLFEQTQLLLNDPQVNPTDALTSLRNLANFKKAELTDMASQNNVIGLPEGKRQLDSFNARLDGIVAAAEKFNTKEDMLKAVSNMVQITTNTQMLDLQDTSGINFALIEVVSKFSPEDQAWMNKNSPIRDQLISWYRDSLSKDAFDGAVPSQLFGSKYGIRPGRNDSVVLSSGFLDGASRKDGKVSASDYEVFKKMIKADRRAEQRVENDADRMKYISDFTSTYSQTKYRNLFAQHPDPSLAKEVYGMADRALLNIAASVSRYTQGEPYTVTILPSGDGIIFDVPGNTDAERQLNELHARQVNDFVKVYASMGGYSTKDAFNDIMANRYGSRFNLQGWENLPKPNLQRSSSTSSSGRPNQTNPFNLRKEGSNEFREFASPEASIPSVAKQIKLYITGESKNVSAPTPKPIDFLKIYNNASESGSATDQQYASNVAKASGLDLNQPIDPNDTATLADLLYGISIAEQGKQVLTRQQIRASLQGR